jgi:tryptophanyl-tRNA synthetase
VLTEPEVLLTEASKLPGLDGAKMSKSYGNTIALREAPEAVIKKIKQMPTDPQRVRRTDPGDPERCPVWMFHQVYSNDDTRAWVQQGCRTAGIGCIECKMPVAEAINAELAPVRERAQAYAANPQRVRDILEAGCARAHREAEATMASVREAMGLAY